MVDKKLKELLEPKVVLMDHLSPDDEEFHERRKTTVGGSDAPVIMGVYDDAEAGKTERMLWEAKLEVSSLVEGENPFSRRGRELEPDSRDAYIEHTGIEITPVALRNRDMPWRTVSLDGIGIDPATGVVVLTEIKAYWGGDHRSRPSRNFELAQSGIIPDAAVWQLEHAIGVLNLDPAKVRVDFVLYEGDGKPMHIIPFVPEKQRGDRLLAEERRFITAVLNRDPSMLRLAPRDKVDMSEHNLWSMAASGLRDCESALKENEMRTMLLDPRMAEIARSILDGGDNDPEGLKRAKRLLKESKEEARESLARYMQEEGAMRATGKGVDVSLRYLEGKIDIKKLAALLGCPQKYAKQTLDDLKHAAIVELTGKSLNEIYNEFFTKQTGEQLRSVYSDSKLSPIVRLTKED